MYSRVSECGKYPLSALITPGVFVLCSASISILKTQAKVADDLRNLPCFELEPSVGKAQCLVCYDATRETSQC